MRPRKSASSLKKKGAGVSGHTTSRGLVWLLVDRRSEEHTSELQSPCNLVCRLLLEKKKHFALNVTRCRHNFKANSPLWAHHLALRGQLSYVRADFVYQLHTHEQFSSVPPCLNLMST